MIFSASCNGVDCFSMVCVKVILALWFHSLLEEGGTMFTFEGTRKNCNLKTVMRIHNPQFYWKVHL